MDLESPALAEAWERCRVRACAVLGRGSDVHVLPAVVAYASQKQLERYERRGEHHPLLCTVQAAHEQITHALANGAARHAVFVASVQLGRGALVRDVFRQRDSEGEVEEFAPFAHMVACRVTYDGKRTTLHVWDPQDRSTAAEIANLNEIPNMLRGLRDRVPGRRLISASRRSYQQLNSEGFCALVCFNQVLLFAATAQWDDPSRREMAYNIK